MCCSDSSSLGAPVLGAEACLDAFEEAFFCICWKTKGPEALNLLSCLEQSLQGEVSFGQCHCCALGADAAVVGGVLGHFLQLPLSTDAAAWVEEKPKPFAANHVVHSPSGCEELYNICWLLIKSTNFAEKCGLSGFWWFLFAWLSTFGAFLLLCDVTCRWLQVFKMPCVGALIRQEYLFTNP